ncbi:hypothetical protein JMN32_17570 [Fulvivirga sp. 29W222]|uniref:Uncharacterized protein n=1 Tax=Fulvivirga marina TaxID=2494733 RepID=A0A937G003_9BACT|nr:hypothetical protein [Fulvivirga marina]MBL6448132.1 hypothetical protein [Fulvivirga marina]
MSNRELDNLFKTKLEDLERNPSANAWERIQAGKQKKKETGIWLYTGIAAAVILLVTLTSVFLLNGDTETPTTIATLKENIKDEKHSIKTNTPLASIEKEKESEISQEQENNVQPEASDIIAPSSQQAGNTENLMGHNERSSFNGKSAEQGTSKTKTNNDTKNGITKIEIISSENQNDEPKVERTDTKILDSHATNNTTVASTNQQVETKDKGGQTMTFNIEDFKATKTVAEVNEPEEEKKSPLKKVAAFAKSLKEGDAGLSELREAKNELFALNFKKENDNSK